MAEDFAGLVEIIVKPLVEFPDELEIASAIEADTIYVDIKVNPDDAGKVIGRQGRVIKAIRTVVRAAASREGMQAEVELID